MTKEEIKISGKTILFTGGTGSFGNKIVEKIQNLDYKEIRIFSRDELKQELMRKKLNNSRIKFYIGDTRDKSSVDYAMQGVDLVFHAAALKQVPSCEFFPMQAVMTNILGGNNVIGSAIENKVKNIVCLSTDKAVFPINAMGMTKALMEKIAYSSSRNLSQNDTIISCVRYGNVMCSRGSVIPLFINQIKNGNTITMTNGDMTRFMMSLQDAIDLVLFAMLHSKQGDLFIKKSPSCTIRDLAIALKRIFKSSAVIETMGIRHGEKIHETLATAEEISRSQDMGDYFVVNRDDRDLNYGKYFTEGEGRDKSIQDYTSENTTRLTVDELEKLLVTLPEIKEEL